MKEIKLFSSILILISICISACEPQSTNDVLDSVELDPENYKVEFSEGEKHAYEEVAKTLKTALSKI